MKRISLITAMLVVFGLMSQTHGGQVTMTWSIFTEGFDVGYAGVSGNVTSPTGETAGENIIFTIRWDEEEANRNTGLFPVQGNHNFNAILEDPLDGDPLPLNYVLLMYDDNGDWDITSSAIPNP